MSHLLIFHGRLHGFVGRMLDDDYFAPRVAEGRRLRLDDPMHGARSRYPDEMEPLPQATRPRGATVAARRCCRPRAV